jgi:excisionase family DNA binding protein
MDHDKTQPELMTVPQAARLYGLGRRTVRDAVKRGELVGYRLSPRGYHRVRRADVESWLRARRVAPKPSAAAHARSVVDRVLSKPQT